MTATALKLDAARAEPLDLLAEAAGRAVGAVRTMIVTASRGGGDRSAGAWGRSPTTPDPAPAAAPLVLAGEVVGALEARRDCEAPWTEGDLALLAGFARQATAALRVALLTDRRRRQRAGIERALQELRELAHEHANHLHAIGALVDMGDGTEARTFIADLTAGTGIASLLPGAVEEPILAGLLLGEIESARADDGILAVDPRSRLGQIPPGLTGTDWCGVVGDLLGYALDGISDLPRGRRRVTFGVDAEDGHVALRTRDLGDDPMPRFRPPVESLLRQAVRAVGGALAIDTGPAETVVTVRIPFR